MELLLHAKIRIARIDICIAFAQAQANYWTAYATSKANRVRVVFRAEERLSELELEEEAFETAQVWNRRIQELGETKVEIISDRNNYFK